MKRGEVWQINLDPTFGAEIRKKRPCVIVNSDRIGKLPLKVIVPLTEWNDQFSSADWLVPIPKSTTNGLTKKSAADTFQLRSLSEDRFIEKLGVLSQIEMKRIDEGLRIVLLLDR